MQKKIIFIVLIITSLIGLLYLKKNTEVVSPEIPHKNNLEKKGQVDIATSKKSSQLKDDVVFSINDINYTVNNLVKNYSSLSGKVRKKFLASYLNYKLTLDQIPKEIQNKYQDSINKKIEDKKSKLKEQAIKLNPSSERIMILKITLDTIGQEEASKSHKKLDKEIKEFYDKNIDKYNYPNYVTISHIVLKNEEQAKELLELIKQSSNPKEKLAEFAYKFSGDVGSKGNYGYIGDVSAEVVGEKFFKKLWKSKESGIVEDIIQEEKSDFYHIVYMFKKQKAGVSKLEDVKNDIREYILQFDRRKWIREYYLKAKEKNKVKTFDTFK